MTQLRVLHVIPSLAATDGGPPRAMALIERALRAEGVSLTTLTTDHGRNAAACDQPSGQGGDRVHIRAWTDAYKVAPGIVPWLARHGRGFDVMHIHGLFSFTSTASARMARRLGVPYIVRPLGTLSPYGLARHRLLKRLSLEMIEGPILRHAAAVHFTSRAEAEEASRIDASFRGAVVPLGVDEPAHAHRVAKIVALEPLAAGRKVILFLSRLDPKKNLEALIDAIAGSERLRQDCMLVVAGDGRPAYVARLQARAEAAGMGANVVWLGHVDGEEKAAALAEAELMVLPSKSENFGIAAVEAMLAGIACVLSPGVAIAEEAAVAGGAVMAEAEPAALALAMTRLIGDDALRSRIGARGQTFARETWSREAMGRRLVALYEGLLREQQSGRR